MKGKLRVALVLMAFTSPAWAHMCPSLMNQIDEALEQEAVTAQLDEAQLAEIRDLRERGEQAHEAGNHDKSVELLKEAGAKLGRL